MDASHIDIKKRGVLDMKETLIPLLKLLSRKEFKERYGSAGGKLKHDTNNDPLDLVFY